MYKGYKINNETMNDFFKSVGYYDLEFDEWQKNICNKTHQCLANIHEEMDENILDGDKIMKDWFPEIEADVFISHSHKDLERSKVLAYWLYGRYGIKSFIDSNIWGYADDLLKIIDNKYCKNQGKKSYNYTKRNYSTSHVHMMLMTALNKMIDKTECVIFIDTPNSNVGDGINNKTLSPWIYGELETTRIIRKRWPERKAKVSEGRQIEYSIDIQHLIDLNVDLLNEWDKFKKNNAPKEALDNLYELKNEKTKINWLI